uniref:dTDP-4-dehydrorhamnose reductase (EC) n=1 Tax=Ganoderma boninense TaxID=34458 RepID=A0A5K1JTQ3_9APHY|nr:dTDP-4-dehydrorhamnose reductase (EC [Ganoderma boninense]
MSSTRKDRFSFGTQSPPCIDQEPMGVCSIRGDKPKSVPDREQRAEYFNNDWTEGSQAAGGAPAKSMGTEKVQKEKIKTD